MKGYVYLVEGDGGRYYKIGRTNSLPTRMKAFARMRLPIAMRLVWFAEVANDKQAEHYLHRMFWPKHINGEWFALTPEDIARLEAYEVKHLNWDAKCYAEEVISFDHEPVPLSALLD
jgi:hypothetical protein